MESSYQFIRSVQGQVPPCKSHEGILAEHLFGNTNWQMQWLDDSFVEFTCMYCGEVRIYKRLTEKVLL